MKRFPISLLLLFVFLYGRTSEADLVAIFNSGTDVPVTAGSYSAAGQTFTASLNFAPPTGTTLTVVNNTGLAFISGTFSNLAQGQEITLAHEGINYRFIANYFGGSGNDLVLQWAKTRPVIWGNFGYGGSGTVDWYAPREVEPIGTLAGRQVLSFAVGDSHYLALCSDGEIAAWGGNNTGVLGNGTQTGSTVPVSVDRSGVLAGKRVVAVSAGSYHSLALCSDGTVAAWGANDHGQLGNGSNTWSLIPVLVRTNGALAGKKVVAISAGQEFSLALCSDGTVVSWGNGSWAQLGNASMSDSNIPVAVNTAGVLAGKTVEAIAAGEYHALAACSDGTIAAWGTGSLGRLGNGNLADSAVPVAVVTNGALAGKTVLAVSAGSLSSLALCSDGSIAAWGELAGANSGPGIDWWSKVPVTVTPSGPLVGGTALNIQSGFDHRLAMCADGTVAAWGDNREGQLGLSAVTRTPSPIAVNMSSLEAGERFTAIFAGFHGKVSLGMVAVPPLPAATSLRPSAITKTSATLRGIVNPDGSAAAVQFEYGITPAYGSAKDVPLTPVDGTSPQSIEAAIDGLNPGAVYHYRVSATNAAGTTRSADGTFATSADRVATFTAPTDVPFTATDFTAQGANLTVNLGFQPQPGTSLTVLNNMGADFIEGRFANLPQGGAISLAFAGMNFRFVADYHGGSGNDLVLLWAESQAVAWGANYNSQLADGTLDNRSVPGPFVETDVLAGKHITRVAAGGSHAVALCSDGTLAAWGYGGSGNLGNGTSEIWPYSPPVAVNLSGALAGKTVIAIAAGDRHTLALCSDGTIAAWGANGSGQLGDGTQTDRDVPVAVSTSGALAGKKVVSIAAQGSTSAALCSDGTVATWGFSPGGITPQRVETRGVLSGKTIVSLARGSEHFGVVCSDGTVACWGTSGTALGNGEDKYAVGPVAIKSDGVLAGKTVVSLALGNRHSVALCSDGTMVTWGDRALGRAPTPTAPTSLPGLVDTTGVLAGKTPIAIAAGLEHCLALCSDGTVAAWGINGDGKLGNNSTDSSEVPVAVTQGSLSSAERHAAIFSGPSAEQSFSLAAAQPRPSVTLRNPTNNSKSSVTLNGRANPNGSPTTARFEYGLTETYGTTANVSLSPNDGIGFQEVSATLDGLSAGTVYHYRLTATDALGTVSTSDGLFATSDDLNVVFNTATDIGITRSAFSAAGSAFNASLNFVPAPGTNLMVVNNAGRDFIHGTFSNLAHGDLVTLSFGNINYRFIANYYGGTGNDLVLQWWPTKMVAWGGNSYGELGDGSWSDRSTPVSVLTDGVLAAKTVISISTGDQHTLALCSDGTVAAWGFNAWGQLGNNTTTDSRFPVLVDRSGGLAGKTVIAVAAGGHHSLALCSDGTVVAWGYNYAGQLGNKSTVNSPVPVLVHAAGVLSQRSVVAIAAGYYHSLAVCSDGTVVGWGENSKGQLGNDRLDDSSVPMLVDRRGSLAGKSVVAVSAGFYQNLALCSDGAIATWGGTSGKVPVPVDTGALAGRTVKAISAGGSHILALCNDGTIAAWGSNSQGQLGNGATSESLIPVTVKSDGTLSGKTVLSVAAGGSHSLAICSDGSVSAWGNNDENQLGDGGGDDSSVPILVNIDSFGLGARFAAIQSSGAANHNFGWIARPILPVVAALPFSNLSKTTVTLNGTVNPDGSPATAYFEYGLTSGYGSKATVAPNPADGSTSIPVSAILSGLTPGATYHYRLTSVNALGSSSTIDGVFTTSMDVTASYSASSDIPVYATGFTATGATFNASLNFAPAVGTALRVVNNIGSDPILGTFNNLAQGQLVTMTYQSVAYRFVANYFGGTGNDLVLEWANARPVAWGVGTSGQLGENSSSNRSSPVSVITTGVLNGKVLHSVATSGTHSLAVAVDGTVAAWGNNASGQLGMTGGNRTSPIAVTSGVLPGKTVISVSAGSNHSIALCSDGSLVSWGSNSSGQLGTGNYVSSTAAVQVDGSSGLAGKKVARVAAGGSHNLALCGDGTLLAWGLNTDGQTGINLPPSYLLSPRIVPGTGALTGKTVVAIAAGEAHSLALCSDGTIAAWGSNAYKQLGVDTPYYTVQPVAVNATGVLAEKVVTAIAAGARFSLALCSDGTVVSWGENTDGQLGIGTTGFSFSPVAVTSNGVLAGKTVVAISAGVSHSVARCADGTIATWGLGASGRLGNASFATRTTPVLVNSASLAPGELFSNAVSGSLSGHNLGLVAYPPSPGLSTFAAANVTESSATLTGPVNAAGGSATVTFDYGTTTSYGNSVAGTPTPITGTSLAPISANLAALVPNTTYHFRVRATSSGGTTTTPDFTFTTLPDTFGPAGGNLSLNPLSPLEPEEAVTISFANWQDSSLPIAYAILVDDVVVSASGGTPSRIITAPNLAGIHTLKARIYDGLGNYTEEVRSMTVAASREDWRAFWFGTATNEGSAADTADPDGDGLTNSFEYMARSSPTDSRSSFHVKVSAVSGQPNQMAITFGPIAAGRNYVVKYTSSLATPIWTPVTDFTVSDNGSDRTITDRSAGNGPRFYRVELQYP